jgi:uncharacterized protein
LGWRVGFNADESCAPSAISQRIAFASSLAVDHREREITPHSSEPKRRGIIEPESSQESPLKKTELRSIVEILFVLFVIAAAWMFSRWCLYPAVGIPDNAPMILRPISGFFAARWLLQHGEGVSSVGLRKPDSPAGAVFVAIALYLVLWLTSPVVSQWLVSMFPVDSRPGFMAYVHGNLPAAILWIAIGWIVGGFFEEFLFRGFLLNRIAAVLGGGILATAIGVGAQAALFGCLHFYAGPLACAHAAYFALLMGLAYLASGRNLWPLIAVHSIWNTVAIWGVYSY